MPRLLHTVCSSFCLSSSDKITKFRTKVRQIRYLPVHCEAQEKPRKEAAFRLSERDETATPLQLLAPPCPAPAAAAANSRLPRGGAAQRRRPPPRRRQQRSPAQVYGREERRPRRAAGAQRQRRPSYLARTCTDYKQSKELIKLHTCS